MPVSLINVVTELSGINARKNAGKLVINHTSHDVIGISATAIHRR